MTGRGSALILVALCLLGPAAVGPSVAAGQGAESEYDLNLPGSGSDESAPPADTPARDSSADDDSGGFPVVVVVLFVAAGAAVGVAIWRLRKPGSDQPS